MRKKKYVKFRIVQKIVLFERSWARLRTSMRMINYFVCRTA